MTKRDVQWWNIHFDDSKWFNSRFDTLELRQSCQDEADGIFAYGNCWLLSKILLKCVPRGLVDNTPLSIGLDNSLASKRWQAIIGTGGGRVHWGMYALLCSMMVSLIWQNRVSTVKLVSIGTSQYNFSFTAEQCQCLSYWTNVIWYVCREHLTVRHNYFARIPPVFCWTAFYTGHVIAMHRNATHNVVIYSFSNKSYRLLCYKFTSSGPMKPI